MLLHIVCNWDVLHTIMIHEAEGRELEWADPHLAGAVLVQVWWAQLAIICTKITLKESPWGNVGTWNNEWSSQFEMWLIFHHSSFILFSVCISLGLGIKIQVGWWMSFTSCTKFHFLFFIHSSGLPCWSFPPWRRMVFSPKIEKGFLLLIFKKERKKT